MGGDLSQGDKTKVNYFPHGAPDVNDPFFAERLGAYKKSLHLNEKQSDDFDKQLKFMTEDQLLQRAQKAADAIATPHQFKPNTYVTEQGKALQKSYNDLAQQQQKVYTEAREQVIKNLEKSMGSRQKVENYLIEHPEELNDAYMQMMKAQQQMLSPYFNQKKKK